MINSVTVKVPATTANLGPGFDCLGAALTLYNQFQFSRVCSSTLEEAADGVKITVTGLDADRVTTDERNLVYQAFAKVYEKIGQVPPSVAIDIHLDVPLARGLGSSATAIVGGLVGANQLAGAPLSIEEVMHLAIAMEGHPDNVVPALIGGCRLAVSNDAAYYEASNWMICPVAWHSEIVPVLAIPDFELATETARKVLPASYSRADVIFNTSNFGLLLLALETANGDWLRVAMRDRIHQPYRKTLIAGYDMVRQAAINSGAYGVVISGAGPTLLALTSPNYATEVATTIAATWDEQGVKAEVKVLAIDHAGAKYDVCLDPS
jgi:homoserine kinase